MHATSLDFSKLVILRLDVYKGLICVDFVLILVGQVDSRVNELWHHCMGRQLACLGSWAFMECCSLRVGSQQTILRNGVCRCRNTGLCILEKLLLTELTTHRCSSPSHRSRSSFCAANWSIISSSGGASGLNEGSGRICHHSISVPLDLPDLINLIEVGLRVVSQVAELELTREQFGVVSRLLVKCTC